MAKNSTDSTDARTRAGEVLKRFGDGRQLGDVHWKTLRDEGRKGDHETLEGEMMRDTKAETNAIGQILWEDWDPIGCGVPRDEYDSYVWPVYRLLIQDAGRAEVETYLRWVADEYITCPVPDDRLQHVLDEIFGLGIKPGDSST